jgi:DNA-directed RNA polymerase specialized sigma24 family protein
MNDPGNLDDDELARRCIEERIKFRAYEEANPCFCLEVFRRGIKNCNDSTWKALQEGFYLDVRRWVTNHPAAQTLLAYEGVEYYIQETFIRLYQASKRNNLDFPTLAAALSFLRCCVNSVMLDHIRATRRKTISWNTMPDETATDNELDRLLETISANELWQIVEKCASSPEELRVAHLLWVEGYKPREIPQWFPNEFSDIQTVRRFSANIIERLRRRYRQQASD